MSDLRVLVVEDEPDGAELVELILNTANASMVFAGTAEEALNHLYAAGDNPFQVAIVDLALPGMDGFDLLRTVQKDAKLSGIPLIAITAFHTPELKAKAIKAGFQAYVPKPLNSDHFLDAIHQVTSQ
jgi:CheY-like chemotaxis protein